MGDHASPESIVQRARRVKAIVITLEKGIVVPSLRPLEQFYCDVCGELIENVAQGYVVYRAENYRDCDFKIIHQSRCDDRSYPKSVALEDFLGARGLIILTGYLSPGPIIINAQHPESDHSPKSLDEFTDFFRRVQVPYYEEARRQFNHPGLLEEYHDHNELSPYFEDTLRKICDTDFDR